MMSRLKIPLALFFTIFSWSCAWVSVRAAVAHLSPGHVALGRYLIASLVLLPVWLWRRPRLEKRDIGTVFVMGLCGFTLYNLGINAGEQTITAGAAALIASTIPIFSALGAAVFLGEKVPRASYVGIGCGVGGVLLIALGEKGGVGISSGALLVILASLCAAIYGILQKRLLSRYQALDLTTMAIWAGTLALLPFGNGLFADFGAAPRSATLNVVFLGIFPGAIGYVLWSYCLSQWPVARVTSFLYLLPAFSIALGWIFLGELPAPVSLWGGALALCGVIWTNWKRQKVIIPDLSSSASRPNR
ncbi:Threonine/homoserine efflux transporter RhtA [Abditibacterium utsteinense]|uniref:Threonine/homoserine efflux transporter RhtA n=1 Tax=Abditibacterium utsteinense TaxID=1960156 RepID=A0A2S8SVZ5_9BACT|nr:DMT family transporter [Abditibacterium utsteinense]PQV64963.1 Threonine/homoserine efflux transporter RhtA [Abditibacterium utsteinense]